MAKKFKFYALWLCLACIIVFIAQSLSPIVTDVLLLNQSSFLGGQVWRFVSAIFVHGGLVHLMYNMFALALFGSMLEKFIGGKKFLWVFFLSGIIANIIAVNFYPASLGASGAVYGILGALVIIKPLMMVWAMGFPMPMFIAGILWVLGGVFGLFDPTGNTGHVAHLGGIGIGFIIGIIFLITRKSKKVPKIEINEKDMNRWENSYFLRD